MPDLFDVTGKKIWIAGHTGLVGSALVRKFQTLNCEILTISHSDLDLTQQGPTSEWIENNKPDAIIMAAAKVGGIGANAAKPADFLYDNLAIAQNVIHAAFKYNVSKLIFLGSSCIYPKFSEQPLKEESLLTGALEPTNEAYAIAKIAGIKLCQYYRRQYGADFISLMPCNIYGPNDRWNDEAAHVIPSLISKIHKTKMEGTKFVEIWGSGTPLREFLHADDLAEAIATALGRYSDELHLNVGSGEEISICDLACVLKEIIGFEGDLKFNHSQPDGAPRKLLDSNGMRALGWRPLINLKKGLRMAYEDFLKSMNHI